MFFFNQGSVVNFDGRNTYNLGIGARRISDDETVIVGANAFYEYEASSGHKRSSLGVELMISMLEFRANKYNAITGTINYNSIDETALDGQDFKLTANLPDFYSCYIGFRGNRVRIKVKKKISGRCKLTYLCQIRIYKGLLLPRF